MPGPGWPAAEAEAEAEAAIVAADGRRSGLRDPAERAGQLGVERDARGRRRYAAGAAARTR
ncbi:hypothetical protein ACFCX0_02075 [Streptomyces sp. NPDC056352]|uniref:hypothetical protein n=1 Tax=Streptomyces sp. NPDC056352 TaxID=3345791 RepID=UPI0035D7585B